MTCDATRKMRDGARGTAASYIIGRYDDAEGASDVAGFIDALPLPECPHDPDALRAAALEEAAERLDRLFVTHGLDDLGSEVCEEVRAMAGDAPGYIGVCRADLEALLDLHDGEPLGLARDAYDRLRGAARRGRDAE